MHVNFTDSVDGYEVRAGSTLPSARRTLTVEACVSARQPTLTATILAKELLAIPMASRKAACNPRTLASTGPLLAVKSTPGRLRRLMARYLPSEADFRRVSGPYQLSISMAV